MEIEQRSVGTGVSPLFGESCLFKGDFKATGYKPVRTISINARVGTAEGAWIVSWGRGLKGRVCSDPPPACSCLGARGLLTVNDHLRPRSTNRRPPVTGPTSD